jgi:hypothetical protein
VSALPEADARASWMVGKKREEPLAPMHHGKAKLRAGQAVRLMRLDDATRKEWVWRRGLAGEAIPRIRPIGKPRGIDNVTASARRGRSRNGLATPGPLHQSARART